METHTETYTKLAPSRQSRMKIDSLLNPPTDSVEHYQPVSPCQTPTYQQGYPPSPGYWRYQNYDTSPGSTSATSATQSSNSTSHHHHMFLSYHPTGSTPSPDPYQPRERYGSVSSSSSANDRRRPPRPKYEEEEMYFIWYHRVDLCQEWKEVRESFNRQFPSRQRRGFQGIQCKFYRFIKEKKCPTLREQRRMRDGEFLREGASLGGDSGAPRFGVIEWANVWYPWMREDRDTATQMQRQHQQRVGA